MIFDLGSKFDCDPWLAWLPPEALEDPPKEGLETRV